MKPVALFHVLVEDAATLHVAQAELAQVELGKSVREKKTQQIERNGFNLLEKQIVNTQVLVLVCGMYVFCVSLYPGTACTSGEASGSITVNSTRQAGCVHMASEPTCVHVRDMSLLCPV